MKYRLFLFPVLLLGACASPRLPQAAVPALELAAVSAPAVAERAAPESVAVISGTAAPEAATAMETTVASEDAVAIEDLVAIDWPAATPLPQSRRGIPYEPGIFNFYLGARFMEDTSFWTPLEDQFTLGFDYTMKNRDSAVGLNAGLLFAGARKGVGGAVPRDVDTWSIELYIGPRAYLKIPKAPIYFYGGVGGSLAYGEVEAFTGFRWDRSSDVTFGAYANAAAMFQINRMQAIGLEWRTLQLTDFSVFGFNSDLNYNHLAFVFSAAF